METSIFRVHKRFESFWKNDESRLLKSPRFIIISALCLLSFFITGLAFEYDYSYPVLFASVTLVFWFLINREMFKYLHPPTELIILIFISLYAVEIVIYKLAFDPRTFSIDTNFALIFFHYLILSLMIILFGFILIDNSDRKQRVLIFYIVLGFLAHHFLFFEGRYLYLIFQIILFLSLFKRTTWLENLTRTELWIYLVFFVALYYFHGTLPISAYTGSLKLGGSVTWISVPLYISKVYRLYLLALIVKAPVILIYNHASLARKLRMSALFQSTVPQLIQFIMLLIIFFLFISGWQAQNLRMALYTIIEQVREREVPEGITYYLIPFERETGDLINVPGCLPQRIDRRIPSLGVVSLECLGKEGRNTPYKYRHFILAREVLAGSNFMVLIRIDDALFDHTTKNLNLLAASSLHAYPYNPDEWQSRLYRFDFWQKDDRIKIYPFVFNTYDASDVMHYKLEDISPSGQSIILKILEGTLKFVRMVTGRIFIPVLNANQQDQYFMLDLVAPIQAQSLSSPMVRMFLLLVSLYVLFNMFVLQRVIQFGEQINKIIVRKFNQLQAGIREISTGNLDYRVEIEGEDEFVELAQRFNYMRRQLKHSMEESREKERLDQELKIAREVQFSFLPTEIPDVPGYNIVASLKTANEVSGDFYDLIRLDAQHFLFTIGDVSGKGSSAAFYMAQMMSLLRFSLQFTREPEEIALRINEYFTRHRTDRQVFITAIIGLIDLEDNTLKLVRAGHNTPLLVGGTERVQDLRSEGMAIGLTPSDDLYSRELQQMEITLEQGMHLFMYTDGVTEATTFSQEGKEILYGEERLHQYLRTTDVDDIHRLHDGLLKDLEVFYGGSPRKDDQTVLIIQRATRPKGIKS